MRVYTFYASCNNGYSIWWIYMEGHNYINTVTYIAYYLYATVIVVSLGLVRFNVFERYCILYVHHLGCLD